jgi:hypothetical protein
VVIRIAGCLEHLDGTVAKHVVVQHGGLDFSFRLRSNRGRIDAERRLLGARCSKVVCCDQDGILGKQAQISDMGEVEVRYADIADVVRLEPQCRELGGKCALDRKAPAKDFLAMRFGSQLVARAGIS